MPAFTAYIIKPANDFAPVLVFNLSRMASTVRGLRSTADAISRAVINATVDPIIMVLDVKARGRDNQSSVIDFTDFYLK